MDRDVRTTIEEYAAKIERLERLIEQLKCCGNCTDCHTDRRKLICKRCKRNPYGSREVDNWSAAKNTEEEIGDEIPKGPL